jgi:hypothetical protein
VIVSKESGMTLGTALKTARAGTRIKIMDATIEERCSIQFGLQGPPAWKTPVVVESGLDDPVVWKAPAGGRTDKALLLLESVENLHLRNFVLDGEDRCTYGIEMVSRCPGVVLDHVEFRGFTKHELLTFSTSGSRDRNIELHDLKVTITQPRDTSAFSFSIRNDIAGSERTEYFDVQRCRFEGPFTKSPVETSGQVGEFVWKDNTWQGPGGDKEIEQPR